MLPRVEENLDEGEQQAGVGSVCQDVHLTAIPCLYSPYVSLENLQCTYNAERVIGNGTFGIVCLSHLLRPGFSCERLCCKA